MKQVGTERRVRRAILMATAPLPKALRARARYGSLARLHLAMARRADVFMVRHPKTGGTWLRVLLTRLYAEKYGLSARRVVRSDELSRQRPGLPRFLSSSGYLSWEKPFGEAAGVDPALHGKKLVLLVRNPCDVAVSWHLQFTQRTSAFKRQMLLHEMRDPIDPGRISLFDFVMHPEIGLPAVIDYYNFWMRNVERMEQTFVVRYEDLRRQGFDTLKRLGVFLGEDFSDEQLEDACAFGSVDNLRSLEQAHYFSNRSLRPRPDDGPASLKVRRAQMGGYREDVLPEQAALMEAMLTERLAPAYGYTTLSETTGLRG